MARSKSAKLCVECVYFSEHAPNWTVLGPGCKRDEATVTDPVDGEPTLLGAREMRKPGSPCGPEGSLWEAAKPDAAKVEE
jgi:hypothetical protein